MNAEHQEIARSAEESRWSACPILLWGTFGTKTPAERRFQLRSVGAMIVAACWVGTVIALHFHPRRIILSVTAFVGCGVIAYLAWELRRYLLTLDELARRMQFEAMAWTYLTGMVLAALLGAVGLITHAFLYWSFRQTLLLVIPFFYLLLEPVRAAWLVYLSRRY